jgi:L-threonate 2-dehydrogenase
MDGGSKGGGDRGQMTPPAAPRPAPPVGVIGLGLMGSAFAARLSAAGMAVVGYDVDEARGRAFEAAGYGQAIAIGQMASHCRIVVIAVYDAGQVRVVLEQIAASDGEALPLAICTTTCTPGEIAGIADFAASADIPLVEVPISGTSTELREGRATALVAGSPGAIGLAAAVLDAICADRVELGRLGDAARTKLAINLILQNNRAALAEGIVFAEKLGLDGEVFLNAARRSAAYSRVMDSKGEKMLLRDFTPQSHISQTLKDARLILHEAQRRDLRLPMTSAQAALLDTAILLAGPDSDSSAVIAAIDPSSVRREGAR